MKQTGRMEMENLTPVRIDIVSDIMCPWCVVGFHQLTRALEKSGVSADIHWHPFELNPTMSASGQNLREHLMQKYGTTLEDSVKTRENITSLGADLGFTFDFREDMRMVNSFKAHQLVEWADEQGAQHKMVLGLFRAHFSEGQDVSDVEILGDIAAKAGLERSRAQKALRNGAYAETVRTMQNFWIERGITGVPAMIFQSRHLLVGARGVDGYKEMLRQISGTVA